MKKGVLIFIAIVLLSGFTSAALGISPAKKEYNYIPGDKIELVYDVYTDNPDNKIELYAEGDLAEYVRFSKKKLTGGGGFKVTVDLPNEIEKPGKHTIIIGAKEAPREDSFLGTSINIRGIINIFVPFPGRYAEVFLRIPDGNVDEEIPVEVQVSNKGKETLDVSVNVQVATNTGEPVHSMTFSPVTVMSTQNQFFRKFLDTTGFKPGNYVAEAIVDFGEINKVNKTFRIGSLFVNVTNFTEKLPQKGIQKFSVGVESLWNNELDEVYADVNITDGIQTIGFRTPSVGLGAWESKNLVGFLDTTELEGKFDTEIILTYAGQQTKAYGKLTITKFDPLVIILVAAGILVVIIIILIVVWRIRKLNHRKNNKYKEHVRKKVKSRK